MLKVSRNQEKCKVAICIVHFFNTGETPDKPTTSNTTNMKNTIEYNGYRATIVQDDSPANPFEEWDCEPPLMVHHLNGDFTTYQGAPDSLREIVNLLPASTWERGSRVPLIRECLNCSLREFAECTRDEYGNTRDTFAHLLSEQVGATPSGWRDALAWFETASALLTLAGIPHHYGQSNGYCQGHSSLVLALATPEWAAKVESFLTTNGLRLRATLSDSKPAPWSATANHRHWRVTMWRDPKTLWTHTGKPSRITFDFWAVDEPSDYTILACLSSEAFCPDSFEEFCSELGYEPDSRRALQTFRRSSAFAKRLQDFFTEHDLKELAEIQ